MILVDHEIRSAIEAGEIVVSPLDDSLINSQSMDFRLGKTFTQLSSQNTLIDNHPEYDTPHNNVPLYHYNEINYFIDPTEKHTIHNKTFEADFIYLKPNEFVLATTMERLELCPTITAKIHGKSSLGRLGLSQSTVAGWIDSGWRGFITLELHNCGPSTLLLRAGMKIGQYVFERTNTPDKHYGIMGRYNNQDPAQGSKGV